MVCYDGNGEGNIRRLGPPNKKKEKQDKREDEERWFDLPNAPHYTCIYIPFSLYIYMYLFHIPTHMYTCKERVKHEYVSRYTSLKSYMNIIVDRYVKMYFILVQGSTKINSCIGFVYVWLGFYINIG